MRGGIWDITSRQQHSKRLSLLEPGNSERLLSFELAAHLLQANNCPVASYPPLISLPKAGNTTTARHPTSTQPSKRGRHKQQQQGSLTNPRPDKKNAGNCMAAPCRLPHNRQAFKNRILPPARFSRASTRYDPESTSPPHTLNSSTQPLIKKATPPCTPRASLRHSRLSGQDVRNSEPARCAQTSGSLSVFRSHFLLAWRALVAPARPWGPSVLVLSGTLLTGPPPPPHAGPPRSSRPVCW